MADEAGSDHEQAWGQWPVEPAETKATDSPKRPNKGSKDSATVTTPTSDIIEVVCGNLVAKINRITGQLTGLMFERQEQLTGPLELTYLCPSTKTWQPATVKLLSGPSESEGSPGTICVDAMVGMGSVEAEDSQARVEVTYQISAQAVKVLVRQSAAASGGIRPQLGMQAKCLTGEEKSKGKTQVTWFGRGPSDTCFSTQLGVHCEALDEEGTTQNVRKMDARWMNVDKQDSPFSLLLVSTVISQPLGMWAQAQADSKTLLVGLEAPRPGLGGPLLDSVSRSSTEVDAFEWSFALCPVDKLVIPKPTLSSLARALRPPQHAAKGELGNALEAASPTKSPQDQQQHQRKVPARISGW